MTKKPNFAPPKVPVPSVLLSPDIDGDGVPNAHDCDPFDADKQHWITDAFRSGVSRATSTYQSYQARARRAADTAIGRLHIPTYRRTSGTPTYQPTNEPARRISGGRRRPRYTPTSRQTPTPQRARVSTTGKPKAAPKPNIFAKMDKALIAITTTGERIAEKPVKSIHDIKPAIERAARPFSAPIGAALQPHITASEKRLGVYQPVEEQKASDKALTDYRVAAHAVNVAQQPESAATESQKAALHRTADVEYAKYQKAYTKLEKASEHSKGITQKPLSVKGYSLQTLATEGAKVSESIEAWQIPHREKLPAAVLYPAGILKTGISHMVGMTALPAGAEAVVRQPEIIPAAAIVGITGMGKAAWHDPVQTAADILIMGRATRGAKAGATAVKTAMPKLIPKVTFPTVGAALPKPKLVFGGVKAPKGLTPGKAIKYESGLTAAMRLKGAVAPDPRPLDFSSIKSLSTKGLGGITESWIRGHPEQTPWIGGSGAARVFFRGARRPGDADIHVLDAPKAVTQLRPLFVEALGAERVRSSISYKNKSGQIEVNLEPKIPASGWHHAIDLRPIERGSFGEPGFAPTFKSQKLVEVGGIKYSSPGELLLRKTKTSLTRKGKSDIGQSPSSCRMKDLGDFEMMLGEMSGWRTAKASKASFFKGRKTKAAAKTEELIESYKYHAVDPTYAAMYSYARSVRAHPRTEAFGGGVGLIAAGMAGMYPRITRPSRKAPYPAAHPGRKTTTPYSPPTSRTPAKPYATPSTPRRGRYASTRTPSAKPYAAPPPTPTTTPPYTPTPTYKPTPPRPYKSERTPTPTLTPTAPYPYTPHRAAPKTPPTPPPPKIPRIKLDDDDEKKAKRSRKDREAIGWHIRNPLITLASFMQTAPPTPKGKKRKKRAPTEITPRGY